jgi:hypothetical protein
VLRRFGYLAFLFVFSVVCAHAADINGKWKGSYVTPVGVINYTYNFKVDGKTLTGTATCAEQGTNPIQNGKIEGDTLSFTEPGKMSGSSVVTRYTGKVIGPDKIKFTHQFADFPPDNFNITRVK